MKNRSFFILKLPKIKKKNCVFSQSFWSIEKGRAQNAPPPTTRDAFERVWLGGVNKIEYCTLFGSAQVVNHFTLSNILFWKYFIRCCIKYISQTFCWFYFISFRLWLVLLTLLHLWRTWTKWALISFAPWKNALNMLVRQTSENRWYRNIWENMRRLNSGTTHTIFRDFLVAIASLASKGVCKCTKKGLWI